MRSLSCEWTYYLLAGILLVCFALTFGCASQFGPAGMSPEQIKEWSKIKDLSAFCLKANYAGVSVFSSGVNIDKSISQGGIVVRDDCTMTVAPMSSQPEAIKALQ